MFSEYTCSLSHGPVCPIILNEIHVLSFYTLTNHRHHHHPIRLHMKVGNLRHLHLAVQPINKTNAFNRSFSLLDK